MRHPVFFVASLRLSPGNFTGGRASRKRCPAESGIGGRLTTELVADSDGICTFPSYADIIQEISQNNTWYNTNISSSDLQIPKIQLIKVNDQIELDVSYASQKTRSYAIFNPPNGDKLKMIFENSIYPGANTLHLRMNYKDFVSYKDLVLNIWQDGINEQNFVYIEPQNVDYSSLLTFTEQTLSDADAKLLNGNTMISMRAIFETLGYTVGWDSVNKSVYATNPNGTTISLNIGSDVAVVNNKENILPVAPVIIDNLTYVPLRFIGEASGYEVDWNQDTYSAEIRTDKIIYIIKVEV
jgi:hypothetical protein